MMALPLHATHDAWAKRWGWLVIALAVLLAYWPLASFQWTLTHGDTLNCWLPWRAFITACLQDGHFPLWNPHQQFGYPIHADLQGPTWYVESLAIGGTIGHSIYTLQALYLLYLVIGGLGIMRLVRTLHDDARIGLIAGAAYALGGFFTGHQMHFYTVISAAWLPWLFDATMRLLREPNWRNAARAALLQGLLLTGGNHTFTIIGSYVLLALFAVHLWRRWKVEGWKGTARTIVWCAAAVVGAACIGAGVLHAWAEAGSQIARSGGMSYPAAAMDPVSPRSLIALLFPYATGTDMQRLGTDAPMANVYMGALMLPLAFASLLRKRSLMENVLLVAGAICALAALGELTPVHRWLWSAAPGMDLFRFPAYFRWFTWLAVIVLAAGTLRVYWSGELKRGALEALLAIMLIVMCGVVIIAFFNTKPNGEAITLYERMRAMDLDRRVLLGAAVSVPLLFLAVVLTWKRKLSFPILLGIVLLEMGWNTSLAQWNTGISDIHPEWLHNRLSALNEGPVIPEMVPTSTYDDNGARLHYLMHNTQDFLGGFSRNGVNTFWLSNAMNLEVEHPVLWNAMAQQPLVYLADTILAFSAYEKNPEAAVVGKRPAVFADGNIVRASTAAANDSAVVTGFRPDAISVRSTTAKGGILVLQQSCFPDKNHSSSSGWYVSIDGARRNLLNPNIAAMAVQVPPGKHDVVFAYTAPMVPKLLALSLITFFGLLFAVVFSGSGTWGTYSGSFMLAGMVCWSLFAHDPKQVRVRKGVGELTATIPNDAVVVMNDDGATELPLQGDQHVRQLRADGDRAAPRAFELLREASTNGVSGDDAEGTRPLYWIDAGLKAAPAVRASILDNFDMKDIHRTNGATMLQLLPRTEPANWPVLHRSEDPQRWLSKDNPYGSGCTITMDQLAGYRDGALVIDLLCASPHPADAVIVVERKRGDLKTDYRTLPIHALGNSTGPRPCYATVPVDELYRAGEELKVYVWSLRGDSISEQGFRVRVAAGNFYRW